MSANATIMTLPDALPPIPPNIAQIAAPLLFGILISWVFYGMLVVQVYIYYLFFSDGRGIQTLVYTIFLLDTLQTCLTGADAFYWFCSGFGNLNHLSNVYLSFFDTPMLGSLMAVIVQSFFCYRIKVLGKSIIIPTVLWLLCLVSFAAAWFSGIRGHLTGNLSAAQAAINTRVLELWLISGAVADTLIAAVLIYLLLKARGAFQDTNFALQRLVRLTMESNALSASMAILSLILYFSARGTSYFLTPTYLFGKIYANSLLVTFNNRIYLQGKGGKTPSGGTSSSGSARQGMGGYHAAPPRPSAVSSFKIEPFNRDSIRGSMEMGDMDAPPATTTLNTRQSNLKPLPSMPVIGSDTNV